MVYTSPYPIFAVTADVVLRAPGRRVLLIERAKDPYAVFLALPGGVVDPDEALPEAAARELAEETGVRVAADALVQLGAFGHPARDPRGRTVSVVHVLDVDRELPAVGSDDAAGAGWYDVDGVLAEGRLAFDHADVLHRAFPVS